MYVLRCTRGRKHTSFQLSVMYQFCGANDNDTLGSSMEATSIAIIIEINALQDSVTPSTAAVH